MNESYPLGKILYYSYCQDVLGKTSLDCDYEWHDWCEGMMTKEQWNTLAQSFLDNIDVGDL